MVERLAPDIVVMDISMPRLNGAQATELIRARFPATQVVVLSMHADETVVRQALRRGAKAYVLKRAVGEELLLAVRAASRGETYLSPPIASSILNEFLTLSDETGELSAFERLTPRERQVLQLLAEGGTNSVIALELVVSVKTVESPEFQVRFRLDPGDLYIVDNTRVVHGRTEFVAEGNRHLQGCYADRDSLFSRLAVLNRPYS